MANIKKTNAVRALEKLGIAYVPVPYTYDSEDLDVQRIAADNGLPLPQLFKTLVCLGDKTGVLIALVPGDKVLDMKHLAEVSGNKRITMAAVKDLLSLTGYVRGGCSPIGTKKPYPVYIDGHARTYERIYVNAGMRGLLMGLAPEDLRRACAGEWM